MPRKPQRAGWSTREQLEKERDRRGIPIPMGERRSRRSVRAFVRAGFTLDEAEGLVHAHFLKPSSSQGRRFCTQRRREVEYYRTELKMTWPEAVARASELREEISLYADSPTGAMADALKWSTKFTTKRIVWGKEPLDATVERFRRSYTPVHKTVEEYY